VEDGERLGERAQEGGVCLEEELAKANCILLGLKYLSQGGEVSDMFYP
jgi:hypothetical protein